LPPVAVEDGLSAYCRPSPRFCRLFCAIERRLTGVEIEPQKVVQNLVLDFIIPTMPALDDKPVEITRCRIFCFSAADWTIHMRSFVDLDH
jgi:hypothetical protein